MSERRAKSKEQGDGQRILGLTALQWAATQVAAKPAGNFRDGLREGLGQDVDFALRFRGYVDVNSPTRKHVTCKPKLEHLLGVVLASLGPQTQQRAIEAVQEAFPTPGANEDFSPDPEQIALVERLLHGVSAKEPQDARGAVSGRVTVELVARD